MTLAPLDRPVGFTTLTVTAHAVPDPDPPYDPADDSDHVADTGDGGAGWSARPPLPPCPPLPAPDAATLRLVPPLDVFDEEDEEESFEPVRTPRADLEDPLPRAAMLTRALLEAMAGTRPVSQLSRWVTEDVLALVQSHVVHRVARPVPTALRRVLVSEPAPGIAEVTAVVDRGPRAEAMALRLEGLDGRWLVTALQRA